MASSKRTVVVAMVEGLHWVQIEKTAIANFRHLSMTDPVGSGVYWTLIDHLKPHKAGVVLISQERIAAECGRSRQTVSKVIKRLEKGNWLHVIRIGSARAYALNAGVVWVGNRAELMKAEFEARVVLVYAEQSPAVQRGEAPKPLDPSGAARFDENDEGWSE